jgi:hypothetical protein
MLEQLQNAIVGQPAQATLWAAIGGGAIFAVGFFTRFIRPRQENPDAAPAPSAEASDPQLRTPAAELAIAASNDYPYDYFLSYSKPNAQDAKLVERILRGRGARVWLQAYDSRMSEDIVRNVSAAIAGSRHFIAMLSRPYLDSPWTMQEVNWFVRDQLHRDFDKRHLVVIECEPVDARNPIFQSPYRGALHGKTGDDARATEIVKALEHRAAEDRARLSAPFRNVPDPPNCVGRERDLARIKTVFFPDAPADARAAQAAPPPAKNCRVLLQAGPGFGKTTLAAHFAREHRGYFSGVWWIRSQDPATLLAEIVAIDPPKTPGSPTPDLAREVLLRRFDDTTAPFLLVFDNVGAPSEDALGADGATGAGAPQAGTERLVVQMAASLGTNVRVLMTSRRPGWDHGAKTIPIEGLHLHDAAAFLMRLTGRDDEDGSRRLADTLGGHPLALDHAGAYCAYVHRSFDEYLEDHLELIREAPPGVQYEVAVFATATKSLQLARKICPADDAVTRLADFLSYCAADRIPRALFLQPFDGNRMLADKAIGALREVGLLATAEAYPDGEPCVSVHRLVQRIIRTETDAAGRSNAVISRLMPFLCKQLTGASQDGAPSPTNTLGVRKYMPHLFQALPHLDAPDFRGDEAGDLLDQVAKLVIRSLEEEAVAAGGDAQVPEHLPRLLGCFYEIDSLSDPLDFLLRQMAGQPKAWMKFRDDCLAEGNYVLRFALSTTLADAIEDTALSYSIREAAALVADPKTLDHFELGGYTLKSYYSAHLEEELDSDLLRRLAAHPCYPGRSILGDLMLNLVYQKKTPTALLPPTEGENHRFWDPAWDFIAYDVNAILAAECINRGEEPSAKDRDEVHREFAYCKDLAEQQRAMLERLADAPEICAIVKDYFTIGINVKKRISDQGAAFEALRLADRGRAPNERLFVPVLRLLFGHPLWSVAEAAANVVADLHSEAVGDKDAAAANDYRAAITALLDPSLSWRVRFGAVEAAYQIRLDESPKMKTFGDAVRKFYNDDGSSKLRGLCAENLVSIMLNANNKRRQELEAEFAGEMRHWVADEDCWVLEHVHRYFHTLAARDNQALRDASTAALAAHGSRLCEGLDAWWLEPREKFLTHIEASKQRLRNARRQGN